MICIYIYVKSGMVCTLLTWFSVGSSVLIHEQVICDELLLCKSQRITLVTRYSQKNIIIKTHSSELQGQESMKQACQIKSMTIIKNLDFTSHEHIALFSMCCKDLEILNNMSERFRNMTSPLRVKSSTMWQLLNLLCMMHSVFFSLSISTPKL